jgi:hypothetical protein
MGYIGLCIVFLHANARFLITQGNVNHGSLEICTCSFFCARVSTRNVKLQTRKSFIPNNSNLLFCVVLFLVTAQVLDKWYLRKFILRTS